MKKERKRTGPNVTDINQCYGIAGYQQLSMVGKSIYRASCKELIKRNNLMFVDLFEVSLYAITWEHYWNSLVEIMRLGEILSFVDRTGNIRYYANPAVQMSRGHLADIMSIGEKFGFDPLSRRKLDEVANSAENAFDLFIGTIGFQNTKRNH